MITKGIIYKGNFYVLEIVRGLETYCFRIKDATIYFNFPDKAFYDVDMLKELIREKMDEATQITPELTSLKIWDGVVDEKESIPIPVRQKEPWEDLTIAMDELDLEQSKKRFLNERREVLNVYLFPNRMFVVFDNKEEQVPFLQGRDSESLRNQIKAFCVASTFYHGVKRL